MEKQKTGLVTKAKDILHTAKEYWTEPPKGNYIPYKEVASLSGAGFGVHWMTTLASTIGALIVTIGALCLFVPSMMAKFFDDVGSYSASVFFYEKQYEKTGDIVDLDKLLLKVYVAGDYDKTEKYSKAIIEHSLFENLSVGTKEYYYGCYVVALANNAKFSDAIQVGQDFVEQNGYTEFNPLRILLSDYIKDDMVENKAQLKTAIISTTNVSLEQSAFKAIDLVKLG